MVRGCFSLSCAPAAPSRGPCLTKAPRPGHAPLPEALAQAREPGAGKRDSKQDIWPGEGCQPTRPAHLRTHRAGKHGH